jgi:type IX secretion system PorP/SprF family membrane protein
LQLKDRIGLGAAMYKDKNGPLDYTGGVISYAFHEPVSPGAELSFGMSVIGTCYSMNIPMLKPDQPDDEYLLTGNDNIFRVNFNLGIYYHTSSYFLGLSATKILPDVVTADTKVKERPGYFLMGGYKLKLNKTFTLEPSVTIKKSGMENVTVDIFSKLYIKRLNWVAVSYGSSGKMSFLMGLYLLKMLYAGYNYEYSLSKIANFTFGTHEIYVGINTGLFGVEGIRRTVNK